MSLKLGNSAVFYVSRFAARMTSNIVKYGEAMRRSMPKRLLADEKSTFTNVQGNLR